MRAYLCPAPPSMRPPDRLPIANVLLGYTTDALGMPPTRTQHDCDSVKLFRRQNHVIANSPAKGNAATARMAAPSGLYTRRVEDATVLPAKNVTNRNLHQVIIGHGRLSRAECCYTKHRSRAVGTCTVVPGGAKFCNIK